MLSATLLTLIFGVSAFAQTLDKAKLDQFLDRLLEKNKGMGSLLLAKDGDVLYRHSFGYTALEATAENRFKIDPAPIFEFDAGKSLLTIKGPQGDRVFTKEK